MFTLCILKNYNIRKIVITLRLGGVVGARRRLLSEEACYDLLLRFFFGEAKGHKLD